MRKTLLPIWAILAASIGWPAVDGKADGADPLAAAAIREISERVITWQLRHPRHELWEWPNGVFYAGMMAGIPGIRPAGPSR
jgi:unsaturated rhamnogalacturonyl hydrolase